MLGKPRINLEENQDLTKISPIFVKFGYYLLKYTIGVIKDTNGSCYYETSSVKLYCSIIGPIPQRSTIGTSYAEGAVNFKVILSPFCYRGHHLDYHSSNDENILASRLASSILPSIDRKSFPYSQIDIIVNVLYHDGYPLDFIDKNSYFITHSLLVPSINAVSLSLSCSSIDMLHFILGASFLTVNNDKEISTVFNPSNQEIQHSVYDSTSSLIIAACYIDSFDSSLVLSFFLQSGFSDLLALKHVLKDYYTRSLEFFKPKLNDYLSVNSQ
ncbi:hypothetical protein HZS_4538 [Henneguya salminicola]|nr:hypothetical protein HZS_4538 [Henneguya salminicola]